MLFYADTLDRQGCGGTLVGTKYVITAAHCTDGMSASNLKLQIGDTSFDTEHEVMSFIRPVKSIKQHPVWHSDAIYCFVHLVNMCAKGISYAGSTDGMYYLQKMRY